MRPWEVLIVSLYIAKDFGRCSQAKSAGSGVGMRGELGVIALGLGRWDVFFGNEVVY